MAAHVLRLDLSQNAVDFEPIALEPGVPTIDRGGGSYVVMRRWFGKFIAEPAWETAGELRFYVHDEHGGRLTQAVCLAATQDDLTGPCKSGVKELLDRLNRAKPSTPMEQALDRAARSSLAMLGKSDHDGSLDGCFIKYREAGQPWQFAWCWGYRRKNHQPADATICTNPECKQLFLRASGSKTRCPGCSGVAAPVHERSWSRRRMAGLLAILAIACGMGLFFAGRSSVGLFSYHDVLAALPNSRPAVESGGKSPSEQLSTAAKVNQKSSDVPRSNQDRPKEPNRAVADQKESALPQAEHETAIKGQESNQKPASESSHLPKPAAHAAANASPGAVAGHNSPAAAAGASVSNAAPRAGASPSHGPIATMPLHATSPAAGAVVPVVSHVSNGLAQREGTVVVTAGPPTNSTSSRAKLSSGTQVTGVNGISLEPLPAVAIGSYIAVRPIIVGEQVQYRTIDGAVGNVTVAEGGVRALVGHAIYEVKLVGVRAASLSDRSFQAAIDLELAQAARYRLVDGQGQLLGEWSELSAGTATLVSRPIARVSGDSYELFVERELAGERKQFQAAFRLTAAGG